MLRPLSLAQHTLFADLLEQDHEELFVGLTVTNYGYPIAQLALRKDTSVPAVYVGANP